MTHKIKSVYPLENYVILAVFRNGIEKKYDMRCLFPVFPQFKDFENVPGLFERVKVDAGGYGISWNDDLDLDAEDIWENGVETGNVQVSDIADILAENLIRARDHMGMTQKQLAEKTGIYQADISKIERGIANPSLNTLKRLAEGMDMTLKLEFIPENIFSNATYQKPAALESGTGKVYTFDYEPPVSMVAEEPAPYGAKKEK